MSNVVDLFIIIIVIFGIVYLISKVVNFIDYSNSSFDKKAEFFYKKIKENNNQSKNHLAFKDLYFLTLEDYLKHFYY